LTQLWEPRLAQDLHGRVDLPVLSQLLCVTMGKCFDLLVPHPRREQNSVPAAGEQLEERGNKGWEINNKVV